MRVAGLAALAAAVVAGTSTAAADGSGPGAAARFGAAEDELLFVRLQPRSEELLYEYDVWVGNARGRKARLVAGGVGSQDEPTWSPDGTEIAFTESRATGVGSSSAIDVVSADGTARRRVAVGASPAWSPDGGEIAHIHPTDGGLDGIRAVSANGARIRTITTGWDRVPTWSPTGALLAFERGGALFVVNSDGSGERQLTAGYTPEGEYLSGFDWSPDGRRLLYTRDVEDRFGTTPGRVYVVNADGTERRLLRSSAGAPAWSPDGRVIAVVLTQPRRQGIYLMRPDGRLVRRLTRGLDLAPVWSRDGRRLAFARYPRGGYETDVWVVDATGKNARNVTRTPRLSEHPGDWRPSRR